MENKSNEYLHIDGWIMPLFTTTDSIGRRQVDLLKREIFAYIYSYGRDGINTYWGSAKTISNFLQISEKSVLSKLNELTTEGYLLKTEVVGNGCLKYCKYTVNLNHPQIIQALNNDRIVCSRENIRQNSIPSTTEQYSLDDRIVCRRTTEQYAYNNTIYNTIDNTIDNTIASSSELSVVGERAEVNNKVEKELSNTPTCGTLTEKEKDNNSSSGGEAKQTEQKTKPQKKKDINKSKDFKDLFTLINSKPYPKDIKDDLVNWIKNCKKRFTVEEFDRELVNLYEISEYNYNNMKEIIHNSYVHSWKGFYKSSFPNSNNKTSSVVQNDSAVYTPDEQRETWKQREERIRVQTGNPNFDITQTPQYIRAHKY